MGLFKLGIQSLLRQPEQKGDFSSHPFVFVFVEIMFLFVLNNMVGLAVSKNQIFQGEKNPNFFNERRPE